MKKLMQYFLVYVIFGGNLDVPLGKLQSLAVIRNDSCSRFGLQEMGVSSREGRENEETWGSRLKG